MQMNEEFGCMYRRFRKNRRRKSFDFERIPAVKIQAANGAVLLKPLPVVKPQAPKIPRNTNGSAQWSPLIVGIGKSACVGNKF